MDRTLTGARLRVPLALALAAFMFSAQAKPASDFNGDGFDDLAVALPGEKVNGKAHAGAVQIFYGNRAGVVGDMDFWHLDSPGVPLIAAAGDRFGGALAAGDFNKDGFSDLAIGAPFKDQGMGRVVVLYGSRTGLVSAGSQVWDQDVLKDMREKNDNFGAALASGDFDADGFYDLAIGVPKEDFPDLGAPKNDPPIPKCTNGICEDAGIVHVVMGGRSGLSAADNELWHQDRGISFDGWVEKQDCFGSALAAADFNGSGADDLAVGCACEQTGGDGESTRNNGAVSVYYSKPNRGVTGAGSVYLRQWYYKVEGFPFRNDSFGYDIAAIDTDKNNRAELAIGIPGEELDCSAPAQEGALAVFDGVKDKGATHKKDGANRLICRSQVGGSGYGRWGMSVEGGDFNGDGFGDLAVGAPLDQIGSVEQAGSLNVLYGSNTGVRPAGSQFITQDSGGISDKAEKYDWFAHTLTSLDFNGDGYTDLAVGTPFENWAGAVKAGVVNLLFGSKNGLDLSQDLFLHQTLPGSPDLRENGDEFGGRALPTLWNAEDWIYEPPDGPLAGNTAPVFMPVNVQATEAGQQLTVAVEATDIDGPGAITMGIQDRPAGATFSDLGGGLGRLTWTPTPAQVAGSPFEVTFLATDDLNKTGKLKVQIYVLPVGGGDAGVSAKITTLTQSLNLTIAGPLDWAQWARTSASSIDRKDGVLPLIGDPVVVGGTAARKAKGGIDKNWIDGTPQATASAVVSGLRAKPVGKGYEIEVESIPGSRTLKLYVTQSRARATLTATLSDGFIPPFTTTLDVPSGTKSFMIELEYASASAGQTLTVQYVVDQRHTDKAWTMFEAAALESNAPNQPPMLDPIPGQSVMEMEELVVGVKATDVDGPPPLKLSASGLPGASFDDGGNGEGTVRWTPGVGDSALSPFELSVQAEDGEGDSTNALVSVEVTPKENQPPDIQAIDDQSIRHDKLFELEIFATDTDGPTPLMLTAQGLPKRARFTDQGGGRGLLQWIPHIGHVAGNPYAITIKAKDGEGLESVEMFDINVQDILPNQPPVIEPIDDQRMQESETLRLDIKATDEYGPEPLTLSVKNLPDGALFADLGGGRGRLIWTPGVDDIDVIPYSVEVTAKDASGMASTQTFDILVTEVQQASLTIDVDPAPSLVDLSVGSPLYWVHWGRQGDAALFDQMAGVPPLISEYSLTGGGAWASTSTPISYSWVNGTPLATTGGSRTGLKFNRMSKGFEITVEAAAEPRVLELYVGAFRAGGVVSASLSDGSAPDVSANVQVIWNKATSVVRIEFDAASDGETLTVQWIQAFDFSGSKTPWISLESAVVRDASP